MQVSFAAPQTVGAGAWVVLQKPIRVAELKHHINQIVGLADRSPASAPRAGSGVMASMSRR